MSYLKMQSIRAQSQNALDNYTKNPIGQVKIERVSIYQKNFVLSINRTYQRPLEGNPKMVFFEDCFMTEFPSSHTLCSRFPNLNNLAIVNCKLSRIDKEDLNGLHNLTTFAMGSNDIESLPRGLFDHLPKLENVSFRNNKIKVIDKDILNPLKNLKYFNLTGNTAIDALYDSIWNQGNVTLAQLKEEIKNKCKPPTEIWQIVENQRKEINDLKEDIATQEREMNDMTNEVNDLKQKIISLEIICASQGEKIAELKKVVKKGKGEAFSNFTVKINEKDFKVNKSILTTNSPVLAKIIHENEEAEFLELTDISEKTFEAILNFMLTKKPPNETSDLIELYAASSRFEMKELVDMTAGMLMGKITKDNALDILKLCKKYDHKDLRKKAFDEFNKAFDD